MSYPKGPRKCWEVPRSAQNRSPSLCHPIYPLCKCSKSAPLNQKVAQSLETKLLHQWLLFLRKPLAPLCMCFAGRGSNLEWDATGEAEVWVWACRLSTRPPATFPHNVINHRSLMLLSIPHINCIDNIAAAAARANIASTNNHMIAHPLLSSSLWLASWQALLRAAMYTSACGVLNQRSIRRNVGLLPCATNTWAWLVCCGQSAKHNWSLFVFMLVAENTIHGSSLVQIAFNYRDPI